jgi:hypothetical protein
MIDTLALYMYILYIYICLCLYITCIYITCLYMMCIDVSVEQGGYRHIAISPYRQPRHLVVGLQNSHAKHGPRNLTSKIITRTRREQPRSRKRRFMRDRRPSRLFIAYHASRSLDSFPLQSSLPFSLSPFLPFSLSPSLSPSLPSIVSSSPPSTPYRATTTLHPSPVTRHPLQLQPLRQSRPVPSLSTGNSWLVSKPPSLQASKPPSCARPAC